MQEHLSQRFQHELKLQWPNLAAAELRGDELWQASLLCDSSCRKTV